jgi:hypothetical protein
MMIGKMGRRRGSSRIQEGKGEGKVRDLDHEVVRTRGRGDRQVRVQFLQSGAVVFQQVDE